MDNRLITAAEAAQILDESPSAVERYATDGDLAAVKVERLGIHPASAASYWRSLAPQMKWKDRELGKRSDEPNAPACPLPPNPITPDNLADVWGLDVWEINALIASGKLQTGVASSTHLFSRGEVESFARRDRYLSTREAAQEAGVDVERIQAAAMTGALKCEYVRSPNSTRAIVAQISLADLRQWVDAGQPAGESDDLVYAAIASDSSIPDPMGITRKSGEIYRAPLKLVKATEGAVSLGTSGQDLSDVSLGRMRALVSAFGLIDQLPAQYSSITGPMVDFASERERLEHFNGSYHHTILRDYLADRAGQRAA